MSELLPGMPLAEPSDATLISLIREGDTTAYGVLYERHLAAARGLARHLIDGEAAEEAVQETFTKVLAVLQRGGGPESGFRPYLLTAVRRTVYDQYRSGKRVTTTGEIEMYDPGVPFIDPALQGLERSMISRAFLSLPERWQAVLWHTEIEGQKPAEVAPVLGLTANGVAALAYRAREGLRQAYLQMHLAGTPQEECRPVLDKLGAYVRGGLGKREARPVEHHLDHCPDCKAIYAELADVNTALRTAIGPLVLGAATVAYLAAAKGGGLAIGGFIGWFRHLPKRQQQALGGGSGAVAAAAVAGLLLTLVADKEPIRPVAKPPPAVPAPIKPAPRKPKPAPQPPPPQPVPIAAPIKPPPSSPPPSSPPPSPSPAKPAEPARLTASIGTVGTLLRDQVGIVAMAVRNNGAGKSDDVLADVVLPPGVDYAGGSTGRNSVLFTPLKPPGGGWSCRPGRALPGLVGNPVTCTHGPLPAGSATSAYLHVDVAESAPYDGSPPRVTLRAGKVRTTAKGDEGVVAAGLPARFAADGHVRTVQVGNAQLSCKDGAHGCERARKREGDRRDNDLWHMRDLDLDQDAGTKRSSSARLELPPGKDSVLWAGLYWSGAASDGPSTVKVRTPGGTSYEEIKAAEVERGKLPIFTAYQAFADVTKLVQQGGGGEWWVADVPAETGVSRYAGWSLVVVVQDPKAPRQQAMVLDGARALGPEAKRVEVPINGLLATAEPARIGVVTWEGDAELPGDRVLLDGRALEPPAGDRATGNVFDSSAVGAVGPLLTFGVDVDVFSVTLGSRQVLALTTTDDAYLTGVVTVIAPMRS